MKARHVALALYVALIRLPGAGVARTDQQARRHGAGSKDIQTSSSSFQGPVSVHRMPGLLLEPVRDSTRTPGKAPRARIVMRSTKRRAHLAANHEHRSKRFLGALSKTRQYQERGQKKSVVVELTNH